MDLPLFLWIECQDQSQYQKYIAYEIIHRINGGIGGHHIRQPQEYHTSCREIHMMVPGLA